MSGYINRIIAGCVTLLISVQPCLAVDVKSSLNERILVIHACPSPKTPADTEQLPRISVYDGIIELLTDKGYRIVDKASAEQCSLQIAATHDIDPLLNKAAAYGLKFLAEYTIFFKTSTITKDHEDSKGALIKVSAKIVDNTSSQIIAAKSSEASSAGLTLNDAIDKAGRNAGKKLAETISAAMEKNLTATGGNGRTYIVIMERNDGESNLQELLTKLEQTASIAAIRESESGGGKTTFEVIYKGKRDQLDREVIRSASELGWKLQKIRSEGNRSTWKIK